MANPLASQETDKEKWLISAPAFSITKVQTFIGLLITGILGALPASLKADRSIVIAAIAAGTLILLGVLALVAIDMHVRQRAEEAKLRYENKTPAPDDDLAAKPTERLRVMRGESDHKFDVNELKVTDGAAHLVATRKGESVSIPFDKSG
jgi:hypothetical protein